MLAHIGAADQDAVNLPDAPTSAITGEDTAAVEVGNDLLDAHLAGRAIAFQSEAINQPHRVGVQRVDLQLLLDLRSEEHTSELQSLMRISYAVFCLTKKTIYNTKLINISILNKSR